MRYPASEKLEIISLVERSHLFETAQRTDGGAGMDRPDLARMAGAPGFEEIQRFRSSPVSTSPS